MENNFTYKYSAKENAEIEAIKNKYITENKDISEGEKLLKALKALDTKVKRPANVFAYVFGTLGAIVMGSGMSLVMTDISEAIGMQNPMLCGIITGIIGMLMAIVNFPIYKCILKSRRKKYADKVLALSNKIVTD